MYGEGMTLQMILDAVAESQANALYFGTHHFVQLSKSHELREYDADRLSSLQYLIPTGATIPEACIDNFRDKLPNFVGVWNGYGLTETGMLLVNNSSKSIGKILPGVQLKEGQIHLVFSL